MALDLEKERHCEVGNTSAAPAFFSSTPWWWIARYQDVDYIFEIGAKNSGTSLSLNPCRIRLDYLNRFSGMFSAWHQICKAIIMNALSVGMLSFGKPVVLGPWSLVFGLWSLVLVPWSLVLVPWAGG